jgi:hypothetical protein
MINKPEDFDSVQVLSGGYEPLERGGHILIIKSVEECESRNGKPMLKINFDTYDSDVQPRFYESRQRDGVTYLMLQDQQGATNSFFKGFITAVANSNVGWQEVWGADFCKCFVGCIVGGVFRGEDWVNDQGDVKTAIKLAWFVSVGDVRAGVKPPDDKKLKFSKPTTVEGEDLPF